MTVETVPAMPAISTNPAPADPRYYESIRTLPSFQRLIAARHRVGIAMILAVMISYVGFFALVAFAHGPLGTLSARWGSLGFLLMLLMFVVAGVATWFYLRHAGRSLAPLEDSVRADIRQQQLAQPGGLA